MTDERVLNCEEALRYLAAYLDGELEATTDGDVESHLARCRSCYSRADFERRMKEQVAALARSEVRPEFAERIRQLVNRFTSSPDIPEG
jgi:anti-sigma factor (TIGR02949 family)